MGGGGVRARTSTRFRSVDTNDAVAEEEEDEVFIAISSPELGNRLAIPPASVVATPVLGGDGDLERGTNSTTFKVANIADDVDGTVDDGTDADTPWDTLESEDIRVDIFESSFS